MPTKSGMFAVPYLREFQCAKEIINRNIKLIYKNKKNLAFEQLPRVQAAQQLTNPYASEQLLNVPAFP